MVGAGAAGLAAVQVLTGQGLAVDCFERSDRVGGHWHTDYECLHLITSRDVSGFEGYPMPADFPVYPSRTQMRDYIESFADAFYFSVQTLATIGYGNLNPATDYGNVIATVEAGVGLIGVALTTGLAFSRLARPKASVLFSRPIVVTTMDGTRVLTFRVGNARGNDVVEASVSVTAMVDTFTREGQHLRKLIDLPLRRSRSPMFRLSWTVMHDLDAGSPLADVDWSAVHASTGGRLVGLNVTLVGHDGTYNQTIYAQYTYQPEDVHLGHRFVDVVSQLPDGRMAIDFSRFHDTVPEAAAPSSPVSAAAPASSPPPP